MDLDRMCPICGRVIPDEEPDCPHCRRNFFLGPDTILGLTLVGLLVLFVITGFAARSYHAKYAALGDQWYRQGEVDLKANRVEKAIVDFRTALVYARDNKNYELSLAKALSAAGRTDEARAYLTSLWERDPGNPQVNLELGRLAARTGNIDDALRYYHSAMYDDWPGRDPAEARRAVRLELYQFLIQRGDRAQAQAELVAMAALLPPDPAIYTEVGRLFIEVGDYSRAASEFEAALKLDRNAGEATLLGAGESEFHLGNYSLARRHLERALRERPDDTRLQGLRDMLEQANLVLGADPFDPNLPLAERNRRAIVAFEQAVHRLTACGVSLSGTRETAAPPAGAAAPGGAGARPPANSGLAALANQARDMQPQVRADTLRKNPDLVTSVMNLVFEIEEDAAGACGSPQPLDRALALLAARRASSEK